jgi:hypothetical protein
VTAKRILLISIISIVCVYALPIAVFLVGPYFFDGRGELEKTLDVFMANTLGVKYSIQQESLDDKEVDLGGDWWIIVNDANSTVPNNPNFGPAYSDDSDYFKKEIKKTFLSAPDLTGYEMYKGEMPLGEDSMCEELPCNIYILRKNGDANVFVSIFKT